MNRPDEIELFELIKNGDEQAFETVFHHYYKSLCLFATQMLKDDTEAEEIVQDLFVKIWEKRNRINIESSVKNYLIRSVKNLCLNYIKHNKIKNLHTKNILSESDSELQDENNFIEVDLLQKIEECVDSLPDKRREIFRLSREEGLKYREIAEKLNISVKTVETQMGLAFKTLREKLKNFKSFLMLCCIFLKK